MAVAAERLCAHLVRLEEDEVLVGLSPVGRDSAHENRHHFEAEVDSHGLSLSLVVQRGAFLLVNIICTVFI